MHQGGWCIRTCRPLPSAPTLAQHARLPALGPDLTLILCGALLIRHAWMQARAAAPPAPPRVTGDHHA
ncbi:hypothetical protein EIM01_28980, partial [Pseudomonas aeruginosa]